jgi:hypothetical protein
MNAQDIWGFTVNQSKRINDVLNENYTNLSRDGWSHISTDAPLGKKKKPSLFLKTNRLIYRHKNRQFYPKNSVALPNEKTPPPTPKEKPRKNKNKI